MRIGILLLAMLLGLANAQDTGWYTSNPSAGTFYISNAAELIGLANLVNNSGTNFNGKTIVLKTDITLTGSWTPIGSSSTRSFAGTFDGNNRKISGLSVSSTQYAGLFGYVGANGQLKNVNVVGSRITGSNYAGGLAAYYASDKAIENSSVVADSVRVISTTYEAIAYSGGLVGHVANTNTIAITNCYATANVRSHADPGVSQGPGPEYINKATAYSGGLIGRANSAVTITNSYATGNIRSYASAIWYYEEHTYSGGLVGYAGGSSNISYSYASGDIEAVSRYDSDRNLGGIFGRCTNSAYTSVYYKFQYVTYDFANTVDIKVSGFGSTTGTFSSKGETNLKKRATFTDWDFSEIWDIEEDSTTPFFNKYTTSLNSVKVIPISDQPYTGTQITPEPNIRLKTDGTSLIKNTDYELSYQNNTAIGTATIKIIGKGSHSAINETMSFQIIPKTLTLTVVAQNKVYDGTTAATITGTLGGVAQGEDVSYEVISATFANKDVANNKAVSVNLALKGINKDNYTLIQPTGLSANITQKSLIITFDPKTIEILLSEAVPNLRNMLAYKGIVEGDAISSISGTTTVSHGYTNSTGAGTYPITLSGNRTSTNYIISYDNADLFLLVIDDALKISTAAELSDFGQKVNSGITFKGKTVKLTNNIALTGNWTPIGINDECFEGTFDGQGYTISGVSVSGFRDAGLFGYVKDGQIKNVNVIATKIKTSSEAGKQSYAGGLVAYYVSTKPIENSSVVADSIVATAANLLALSGGLLGYVHNTVTISNSYAAANVSALAGTAECSSGGLVGFTGSAITITNSYASGNVSARGSKSYSGGLVGYATANSPISYSYASGNISAGGTPYVGGIIGRYSMGTMTSVYYKSEGASKAAGSGSPTGILAILSANLKKQETFSNWNFEEIWGISSEINNGYPYLQSFNSSSGNDGSSSSGNDISTIQTTIGNYQLEKTLYFSIKGSPLGATKPSKPGIYIEKLGKNVRKIVVQ
jgi:hypothetical protein